MMRKPYQKFSQSVLPLIKVLAAYAQTIITEGKQSEQTLTNCKLEIVKILSAKQSKYPEWVYAVGFNPGLRAGFRFFLLTLERITDLFFSIDYASYQKINRHFLTATAALFAKVMQENNKLLNVLADYFQAEGMAAQKFVPSSTLEKDDTKNNKDTGIDFYSDVTELEQTLNKIVPSQLELLDISADYLILLSLLRQMKDIRELLLQLIAALPQ